MDSLFKDLLVIDCASFVAGPAAATMLADFGARVIKVEPPSGDGYRQLVHLPGMPQCESNYPWSLTNRNKESLVLDLKQQEDRAIFDQLLSKADVFVTNYPLGVRERLQLEYEDIAELNPGIIYASLTPYGEEGPEAGLTGYDATAWWARSGLMNAVRASPDTPPGMSVPAMGDHMSACSLYGAIVTALYQRTRTGRGAKVGTSLLANGLWSNGIMVQGALDGADTSHPMGGGKLSAFTQTYRCRDDRWFVLTVLPQAEERSWPQLTGCLGREEWIDDPRFTGVEERKQNMEALTGLFVDAFMEQDWSVWEQRFAEYGVTCGRIALATDHGDDAQVHANGMLPEWADASGGRTLDSPIHVSGAGKLAPRPAPGLGEHTERLRSEFTAGG